jgi:hypothetical protein
MQDLKCKTKSCQKQENKNWQRIATLKQKKKTEQQFTCNGSVFDD